MLWFTQIQRVSLIGILLLRIWIELLISIFNVHAIQCVYTVWMIVLLRHRKTKCDVKLAAFNLIMSLIMWKEIAFCTLPVLSTCQSWMQKSRCREIIVPCIFVKNICYFTKYNSDYYSLHIWVVACYLKKLFASINWTWSIFAKKHWPTIHRYSIRHSWLVLTTSRWAIKFSKSYPWLQVIYCAWCTKRLIAGGSTRCRS